jgi:predicted ATP-dependent serine protease
MRMRRLTSRAFVGRAGELGVLEAALARAVGGEPGALLVAGEAGVGKTRLILEFGARAEAAGVRVVVAAASSSPVAWRRSCRWSRRCAGWVSSSGGATGSD